jgi:HEAT repeat protein
MEANFQQQMTTLEKLQMLDDGQFHQLADAILKRVESRYRELRTHGVNDKGISIKGQPDSYVGNSARSCTIAFCYTVETKNWWSKVCEDVAVAVKASSNLQQIVIAIPRDVDREGPKDKQIVWEERVRTAANNIPCSIYDGRKLSGFLDEKYQDLRYEHLGIPFSRLSSAVIERSCNVVNQVVIGDFKAKGRYDPQHYVAREADDQLKQLWREAFGSKKGCRLIPIVNDSGVGKTSLLCSFAESSGASVPVLLLQARDCGFHLEDALVRAVMQKLQGVLSPALQMQEEVALTKAISTLGVLTVVLDGLDEVRNPLNVGRALKFWLESAIGRASILIVSSRPDFWRRCSDKSWERWVTPQKSDDRRLASKSDEQTTQPENRILGYTLPERFSPNELRLAWNKFGLEVSDLEGAPNEVRQELSHPLTLRAWVDIIKAGNAPKLPNTRDEIIELWIRCRLEQEVDSVSRISAELLWTVMIEIAKRINAGGETYLSVDELSGVPRFDPSRPPGEAVERLINANLFEFIEGRNDSIRFVLDTVYEFFLAEADFDEIRKDSQRVVSSIGGKTFSKMATRLGRIGSRLAGSPEGDVFASSMAGHDHAKALAIIQGRPNKFSAETRRCILNKCRDVFWKSTRPEMAFLIERIGFVNCEEARETLATLVLPWENCPYGLHMVASYSIVRLNHVAGIPLLLGACWWFDGRHSYYHRSILSLLRNASAEFREELAKHAIAFLAEPSESYKHAQAVSILGYLGDERLIKHLNERLQSNNGLYGYENRALFAVGSLDAAEVFVKLANLTAAKIEAAHGKKEEEVTSRLWYDISLRSADLRYLVTEPFEKSLLSLIDGPSTMATRFGVDIANSSRKPSLIRHIIFSGKRDGYPLLRVDEVSESLSASDWLEWWGQANSNKVKASLLNVSGKIPDVRIEIIAMNCLRTPELRGSAAHALASLGSIRCLPDVREALDSLDIKSSNSFYPLQCLVLALGELCDGEAVGLLTRVAVDNKHHIRDLALDALAKIGTDEAANALITISNTVDLNEPYNHCVIESLIAHGSLRTVNRAIEIADNQSGGPKWLVKQMRHVFLIRGLTVGEYYTHVQDAKLIEYLFSAEGDMSPEERRDFIHCFEQIDSDNVRRMLWVFAKRAGTDKDVKVVLFKNHNGHMLSSEALGELTNRTDELTLPNVISSFLECKLVILTHQMEQLAKFPSLLVVSEVKTRLRDSTQATEKIARLLSILGAYGTSTDAQVVSSYSNMVNESVRNVSDETIRLLLDPLRLAEGWREILFAG